MVSPVFFSPGSISPNVLDKGCEPFQALSIAFIDQFKKNPTLHDTWIKPIVDAYFDSYPNTLITPSNLNASERLLMLINNNSTRISELVARMTPVLKRLAILEIKENPVLYPEVFDGLTPDTSEDYLLHSTLPARALEALTNTLGLTITLSHIEPGKEVRRPLEIFEGPSDSAAKMNIRLQVQGTSYFPEVIDKDLFAYVGHAHIPEIELPQEELKDKVYTSFAQCFKKLDEEEKNIATAYKQTLQKLMIMFKLGDLSSELLLDAYVKFFPNKQTSTPPGAVFLSKVKQKQKEKQAIKLKITQDTNHQDLMLLDTLSGWVSTKQIPGEDFWKHVEENCTVAASPLREARVNPY